MNFLKKRVDPVVCPGCGSAVGGEDYCPACGGDLRGYEKLPFRSEWEEDDQYPHFLEHASEEALTEAARESAGR